MRFRELAEAYMRERFKAENWRKLRNRIPRPKDYPETRNGGEILYDDQFRKHSRAAAALKKRAYAMLRGGAA